MCSRINYRELFKKKALCHFSRNYPKIRPYTVMNHEQTQVSRQCVCNSNLVPADTNFPPNIITMCSRPGACCVPEMNLVFVCKFLSSGRHVHLSGAMCCRICGKQALRIIYCRVKRFYTDYALPGLMVPSLSSWDLFKTLVRGKKSDYLMETSN